MSENSMEHAYGDHTHMIAIMKMTIIMAILTIVTRKIKNISSQIIKRKKSGQKIKEKKQ